MSDNNYIWDNDLDFLFQEKDKVTPTGLPSISQEEEDFIPDSPNFSLDPDLASLFVGNTNYYKPSNEQSESEKIADREGFWDSMPAWYKQAYNQSIGGMIHEIMTGESYYNIDDAPQSLTRDIVAGMLSFFASKEDLALLIGTGGVGSVAARAASKGVIGTAAKRRVATMLARKDKDFVNQPFSIKRKAIERARGIVDDVVQKGGVQGFILGTHHGLWEAANHARDDMIASNKDLEKLRGKDDETTWANAFGQILKKSRPEDFVKMGALGFLGGASQAFRWVPKGDWSGSKGLGLLSEGLTFGGAFPVVLEGRPPTFQDFAIGAGIVGALSVPGAAIGRYRKMRDLKFKDEVGEVKVVDSRGKEITLLESAAREQEIVKVSKDPSGQNISYHQIGKKIMIDLSWYNTRHTSKKGVARVEVVDPNTGKVVLDYTKKQFQRYSDSSGQHLEVRIRGRRVAFDPKEAKIKGDRDRKILEREEKRLGQVQDIAPFDVQLISESYKSGQSKTVKIRQGRNMFELDELNTNLFFRFWSANKDRMTAFEREIAKDLSKHQKKDAMARVHRESVKNIARMMKESENDFIPEDLIYALEDVAYTYGNQKWIKMLKEGKVPGVDKMSDSELFYLSKHLEAARNIRTWMKTHKDEYNVNLLEQITGRKYRSPFSRMMGAVKPAYDQLETPAAKKTLRLLQNVNLSTMQKVSDRLTTLSQVLNEGDKSEFWTNYLRGVKTNKAGKTQITAWEDLNKMQELGKKVGRQKQHKKYLEKLEKDLLFTKDHKKKQNIRKRIDFIRDLKDLVTDEIWADASKSGLSLAEYIPGYLPRMFRREVLDILFDTLKTFDEKVDSLTKDVGLSLDSSMYKDRSDILNKLNSELRAKIEPFKERARKNPQDLQARYITKAWQAAEDLLKTKEATGPVPNEFDIWALLQMNNTNGVFKTFAPLEKSRKLGAKKVTSQNLMNAIDSELMETNVIRLMGEYLNGATKRIEMTKTFGRGNEYFRKLKEMIPHDAQMHGLGFQLPKALGGQKLPLSVQTERDAVQLVMEVLTGTINFDKQIPLAKSFQTLSNLEMTAKISLGYAVIPNLTQTFISTALGFGNGLAFKSTFNLVRDAKTREFVKRSGATMLTAWDEYLTNDAFLQIGTARMLKTEAPIKEIVRDILKGEQGYRDGITAMTKFFAKPFSAVNSVNQQIAAATTEQFIVKAARALTGKSRGLLDGMPIIKNKRQAWIKNKLERLGLNWKDVQKHADAIINRKYGDMKSNPAEAKMRLKVLRAMQRFSLESQLQRNFMLDPFLFNDPFMKPLLLFKRFGYRQAMFAGQTIEREMVKGNVFPILNLAVGGYFGGQFVMWAKEELNELITGKEQYYGRSARQKMLKESPQWQDLVNAARAVGSFGALSDIMVDEEPANAIKFFLKPVVIDDFMRMTRAYDSFATSMQTHYPDQWDVPIRKAIAVGAPVAGGPVSKLVRRTVETEGMKKDQARARKRDILDYARDLIEEGRHKEAAKQVQEFNRVYGSVYPSLRIISEDISWNSIVERWKRKTKEQREEKEYIG
tara:strand:- start:105 stop:4751 length:4647 start_codon:yes stop_codon:yes gene_type:complete